jgi:hypothetical protein
VTTDGEETSEQPDGQMDRRGPGGPCPADGPPSLERRHGHKHEHWRLALSCVLSALDDSGAQSTARRFRPLAVVLGCVVPPAARGRSLVGLPCRAMQVRTCTVGSFRRSADSRHDQSEVSGAEDTVREEKKRGQDRTGQPRAANARVTDEGSRGVGGATCLHPVKSIRPPDRSLFPSPMATT